MQNYGLASAGKGIAVTGLVRYGILALTVFGAYKLVAPRKETNLA